MEARKDTRKFSRIVPFCAVACVLLGACFLGLGGVRLYSLSLEGKINELSRRVEAAQEEKSLLEVRMAELMAPPRVHSSARTAGACVPPSRSPWWHCLNRTVRRRINPFSSIPSPPL